MAIFPGDKDGLNRGASGYGSAGKEASERKRLDNSFSPKDPEPYGAEKTGPADTAQESRTNADTNKNIRVEALPVRGFSVTWDSFDGKSYGKEYEEQAEAEQQAAKLRSLQNAASGWT